MEAAQLSGNIASTGAAARLLASEMVIFTGSGSAHTRSTSVVGFKCLQDLQRVLQIHQSLGARAGSLEYTGGAAADRRRISYHVSAIHQRLFRLLSHFLKLTTKHSSVIAVKRDMEPISFLAFGNQSYRKILGVWSISSSLRNNVDHQVPGSRLTCICQSARDRLLCLVRRGSGNPMQRGSRRSGQPGNICSGQRGTTPRGGARRLLNNGLRCGERVVWETR